MSRIARSSVSGVLTVAVLAALPGASALAQPRAAGVETSQRALMSRRITMGVGRTIIVDIPADASEIVIGDPKVANAIVRSARKLYIMGVATGQTTIMALDGAARQIANLEINVGRDLGELERLIQAAIPGSKIMPKQVNDAIILTGEAESAGEAANAMDIAKAFASKSGATAGGAAAGADGAVVNAISIRAREQVMVKITVAEVQRTVLKQLGVSTNPTAADTILKTGWATLTQQNPFSLNGQLSNGGLTVPLAGGSTATLSAFERYGVSRILSEPTATVISGEMAKFTVGGEIPVASSSSCTVGTFWCNIGYTYKPYGVSMSVTPVVVAAGRIYVRLATEVTEIDTTQTVTMNSVSIPGFRTRKNETSVELPSGGSIATAGLITNNSRNGINGLPGLMNLPILGALFRSRDYQRAETELLVVVTPYIARPTAPNELARPDDNFTDPTDPQAVLLGRVNKLYASPSNPEAMRNLKGRFGFIQD
ncbi:MAG: type II and III secretion system protein family protein [Hyphomicrobiales bacterium]|nr:type II and III secretion system protein family protein [Hyphomicrobiales bacterium]